jgi:RNA polymerase sigma factor (sigma-70 family)
MVDQMNTQFEDMMKKLSPTLRRIAHRLNGRFTFFNEDDLFQEAITHLWLTYNKGTLSDKTDSYILQGCFFYLKNYIRTALDKATLTSLQELINESESPLEELIAAKGNSATDVIDDKLIKEYTDARLDDRERKVLELAYEGLTVREIGRRLGISHVMVVKIRGRLKKKITHFKDERGYQN